MPIQIQFFIQSESNLSTLDNYVKLHAAFLSALHTRSPNFSDYLHSGDKVSHYSLSFHLDCLVLNLLDDINKESLLLDLSEISMQGAIHDRPFHLELTQIVRVSYLDIYRNAKPLRRINMTFLSPVSFRQKGRQIINPSPDLIFTSLLTRWNSFSNMSFDFREELFRDILWDKYSLSSVMADLGNYKIKGFTGSGSFLLWKSISPQYCRMLNALSDFARFSGVGYKTTMGFGGTVRT